MVVIPLILGALAGRAVIVGERKLIGDGAKFAAAIADKKNAAYVAYIKGAEVRNGLPAGLMLFIAWKESRFNPLAKNASGASGMFQIMPDAHPEIKASVFDWRKSADYAAVYMKKLFKQFGRWEPAVKAYNCGPGNMAKLIAKTGGKACNSAETLDYWDSVSKNVQGLIAR
jgi:soluble lytic murein transglycosylase-like protein